MHYAASVLKRHDAIVELQEPVAKRPLDDQVRQIVGGRENVVEQHPVGVQRSQPLEGAPRAFRCRRHQLRMADDLLLEHRRILGAQLAARRKTKRSEPQRPLIGPAKLLQRPNVHGPSSEMYGERSSIRPRQMVKRSVGIGWWVRSQTGQGQVSGRARKFIHVRKVSPAHASSR